MTRLFLNRGAQKLVITAGHTDQVSREPISPVLLTISPPKFQELGKDDAKQKPAPPTRDVTLFFKRL